VPPCNARFNAARYRPAPPRPARESQTTPTYSASVELPSVWFVVLEHAARRHQLDLVRVAIDCCELMVSPDVVAHVEQLTDGHEGAELLAAP
jgi:hypothetical protein